MFAAPAQFVSLLAVLGAILSASAQHQRNARGQTGGIAMKKCKEYGRLVFREEESLALSLFPGIVKVDQCFKPGEEGLIIGGEQAKPKEFPHMARIGYGQGDSIVYRCGGSLISPNFVLTAAHCLTTTGGFPERRTLPARMVLLGELDSSTNTDDARPQLIEVAETVKHPDYKPPLHYFDIGLLRLQHAANVTHGYVRPACLHTEPSPLPRPILAVATGWGRTNDDGDMSDHMMKVTLPIKPYRECKGYFKPGQGRLPWGILKETQLCAGDSESNKDTCQGDSGGPLQFMTNKSAGDPLYCMHHIVGITSFGVGCAMGPGVYTRVSHFVPWIESVVWPNKE